MINLYLSSRHVTISSHTSPRSCHTHLCFHLVRFSGYSFIFLVCSLPSVLSSGNREPHSVFSSHTHRWHANCFPSSFHTGRGDPSAPISVWPYCWFLSTRVSSFCFFTRNDFVIVFVSHPSIVGRVHDQFSLPKEKTAYTWSTNRCQLSFHGTCCWYILMFFQKVLFVYCIRSSAASHVFP